MSTKRMPAADRKKQILRNAIHVFARSTYHGATTKGIADEAGVTEALIYRYFGSKRALFTEAVHLTSGHLVQGLEDTLAQNRDHPIAAITQCFQYYVQLLDKHQDFAKMIFLVLSELDQDDIRQTYLPYQERALKAIAEAIDHWKTLGLVPDFVDTKTASWLCFGTYLILALVKQSSGAIPMDPTYAIQLARAFVVDD